MVWKIGQVVQYVGGDVLAAQCGAKAIIVGLEKAPKFISLLWIDELSNAQAEGGYYPSFFVKTNEVAPKKYLKMLLKKKLMTNLDYLETLSDRT